MARLCLRFPFFIGGAQRESCVETEARRTQAIVSFSLPHELRLSVPGAELVQTEYSGAGTIYLFEFKDLDGARGFMDDPVVDVEYRDRGTDAARLEREADERMSRFSAEERRTKKRRMVTDDEGFVYYE